MNHLQIYVDAEAAIGHGSRSGRLPFIAEILNGALGLVRNFSDLK